MTVHRYHIDCCLRNECLRLSPELVTAENFVPPPSAIVHHHHDFSVQFQHSSLVLILLFPSYCCCWCVVDVV
ncbi:hypothetical protein MtrunA17_Chr8g0392861 [Medicago truncatula]|uniref:Uncharacterized protein n=1 Tax=Medicago truncatula TaxID=3880 RepID=Q1SN00_MEDTR|nr:hypothetical protein MtrDRAFT_AC139526g37v2 [Medicago truncatula]RHN43882.1 hypothetical protein MtrunA17_Chr8g0392671 [Medicago truncatula]RHN43901.1 hypothetical protein MtrunA17_Chr8g0392861 [Medicago truncatula]